jgi:hypothetical protein
MLFNYLWSKSVTSLKIGTDGHWNSTLSIMEEYSSEKQYNGLEFSNTPMYNIE